MKLSGEDKTLPVFETLPQDLVVTEGEDAFFECRISSGVESIHWYKDDDSIPSDDEEFKQSFDGRLAQLSISETYLDDAALYRCKARNTAGESSCTVRLSVNGTFQFPSQISRLFDVLRHKSKFTSMVNLPIETNAH